MFESSLISLDPKKPSRRRLLSLPIAVGLHLAALATFTFASYWHVEGVPEPPSNDIYIIQAKLPELPAARIKKGGGAPPAPEKKAQAETPKSTEPVQPKDTLEILPVKPAASSTGIPVVDLPPGPGDRRSSDTGDPNGKVDGVSFNGKGPDTGLHEETVPPSNEPIYVTGAVTRPVFLGGSQPRYTEVARHAGIQGTVVMDAVIDEHGRVQNVQVVKALSMGLNQAAVDAVRTWTFKSSTLANRPVSVFYTLTVNFTLQR